ncbi:MAG: hypothetical protein KKC77_19310 [Proteobacteria bacterium]|nr:hypothetical protein [Pseudomonadota bacterium]
MKLYYHKTAGGAEYLTDTFIECENGHKEGELFKANYLVRIDGDITKDAELFIKPEKNLE